MVSRKGVLWAVVLLLGVMAAPLVCAGEGAAAEGSRYIRIQVSPECTLYMEFRGGEMRAAETVEGLEEAAPIKAAEGEPAKLRGGEVLVLYSFSNVELPVPVEALPAGFVGVKANLSYQQIRAVGERRVPRRSEHVYGKVGLSKEDVEGAVWTYWGNAGASPGRNPERAPSMSLPKVGPLSLQLDTQMDEVEGARIAVVVKPAGGERLEDITKNGKSVEATLKITDRDGKAVASETGPLSKFGYT